MQKRADVCMKQANSPFFHQRATEQGNEEKDFIF